MTVASVLFAIVLGLSSLAASVTIAHARAFARAYVRFAAVLYVALAIASLAPDAGGSTGAFARAVALVVCVLAPSALAIALVSVLRRPVATWSATLWLVLACLGGVGAAVSEETALGFVPLALGTAASFLASLRAFPRSRIAGFEGAAASLCFVCAASALMAPEPAAHAAVILFSAAGLLGATLALLRGSRPVVEKERRRRLSRVLAVSRER